MHDDLGRFPVAALDIDHLQHQPLGIERQALGAALEQQGLAMLDPQLIAGSAFAFFGEGREHVVIIDDAVLEDLDEAGALVRVGRLEHRRQILVHVDRARHEARAPLPSTKAQGVNGRSSEPNGVEGNARADMAGRRILALGQAVDLVVEQQHLAIQVAADQVQRVVAADRQARRRRR